MAKDIRNAFTHSRHTLIGDALGAAALCVMLYGGLVVPSLF